jgi:hypothetical protein
MILFNIQTSKYWLGTNANAWAKITVWIMAVVWAEIRAWITVAKAGAWVRTKS